MTGTTCDSSVLVAALVSWHPDSEASRDAVRDVRKVPAHVLIETFSVLTRMEGGLRPEAAAEAIAAIGWEAVAPDPAGTAAMLHRLTASGTHGGAVYDALIAETARQHDLALVTRDVRARRTYEAIGASYRLI